MSADNYIAIIKGGDGKFRGYMEFMSLGSHRPGVALFVSDTAEDAIRAVQKYIAENIVEYGYQFVNI